MAETARRSPVIEYLVRAVTERIRSGEWPVGAPLPSIRKLAALFRASPRTVETALRLLAERQVLQHRPGCGYRVRQPLEQGCRVAVLHQDYGQNDRRPMLLEAIEAQLAAYGYPFEAFDLRAGAPDLGRITAEFGAVISARYTTEYEFHDRFAAAGLPHVVACRERQVAAPGSYVDHYEVMRDGMALLFGMGHRKIAFIIRDPELYFYPEALRAYREVQAELDLALPPEYEAVMKFGGKLGSFLCVRELLKLPEPPTALIAGRDFLCRGAYEACRAHGLTVGRDISLLGFDDIGWPEARHFLSTYHEPVDRLGRAAVDIMHDILLGGDPLQQRKVDCPLLMRQSVAPILRYLDDPPADVGD